MTEALQKPTLSPAAKSPAAPPEQVTLTTQDLSTAQQIINLCVSRGAIKAEEMAVVGVLYNKLNSFLQGAEAAAEAAKQKAVEKAAADADADATKVAAKKAAKEASAKKKAPAKKTVASDNNDSNEK